MFDRADHLGHSPLKFWRSSSVLVGTCRSSERSSLRSNFTELAKRPIPRLAELIRLLVEVDLHSRLLQGHGQSQPFDSGF